MAIQNLVVKSLGLSFTIQTDESKEYIEALTSEIDKRISTLQQATKVKDPLKLTIINCMLLLDELSVARRNNDSEQSVSAEVSALTQRMISVLDENLRQ